MIRLLVDSSSDYTLAELKERKIELVPLTVTIADNSYKDVKELKCDHFYELLTGSNDFPKTSQPSPQDFADIFEDVKEKGDEIICILLSSALSGTYQSATIAKDMVDYDGIYIIDSCAATVMIKLMADYAAKLISDDLKACDIVKKVSDLRNRIQVIAGLDTLEYLYKGGRLSRASATIGELANIKPIITVPLDGKVGVVGKCLGKNKAINFIINYLEEHEMDPAFPLYSLYSYGTDNCEKLEERINKLGLSITERRQIGSTIGAHVGPGAFAIIYVSK